MKVIDRITQMYVDAGRKHFTVPHWSTEEEPFVIYFSPMTLGEKGKISQQAGKSEQQAHIYTLIEKAEDVNGNKLFNLEDKITLLNQNSAAACEFAALTILEVLPLSAAVEK